MNEEPEWLDIDIVLDFHAEQLALFGGADGIRDRGLLESALARPINKFSYGENSLAALAAAYGFGIARNHAFIDGNKRTALASIIVFLGLNGLDLDAPPEAATAMILSLAAGEVTEDVLAGWIKDHIRSLEAPGIAP
jgi:death-on-curing protein